MLQKRTFAAPLEALHHTEFGERAARGLPKLRVLMIGAGGMADGWIRRMLPRFFDRMEIVGLCDVVPKVLHDAADFLQLPASARFASMDEAFAQVEADCAIVVIPPAHHRAAIVGAAARGMAVFSEKPIADTWEASVDVYHAVARAGVKMAVIQNYRYTPRILTVKKVLTDGVLGTPRYIMARFADDYRVRNAWGKFRHEIRHSLLIEGSVHHFDQIRNLSGADCAWIAGREWRPEQTSFDGECMAQFVCQMGNGVMGNYEGSGLAAGRLNGWHAEAYRVECEDGAVSVDRDQTVRIVRHRGGGRVAIEEVEPLRAAYEGHQHVMDTTFRWFAGEGPAPETAIADNIRSAAMLFAAIEASATGTVVHVPAMLQAAGIATAASG